VSRLRIAPWTLGAVCFAATVCVTPVSLGQSFILAAGSATPLWMLLSAATGLLGVDIQTRFIEAPLAPWAAWLRNAFRYPLALFYALGTGLMLNVWLTILGGTELAATPRLASALLLVTVMAYMLRVGFDSAMRLLGLIALVIGPSILSLLIAALTNADFARLLPHPFGTGAIPWLWPTFLFASRGFDVLPALAPFAGGSLRRVAFVGVALGSVITFSSVVVPILVWGYPAAAQWQHPLLKAIGTYTSVYAPFERIAFVSFIAWQLNSFAASGVYALSLLVTLRAPVDPVTPWWAVLPVVLITLAGALPVLPLDVADDVLNLWSAYGLLILIVLPAALLLLGRVRARAAATA